METICVRIKLKKNSLEGVREWFKTLRERPSEVLQTLENEGVLIESVFLDQHKEDDYLIYYMRAESLEYAHRVSKNSLLPIDRYHQECKEKFCLEKVKLETLLDFHV